MNVKIKILVLIFLFAFNKLYAQSNDLGVWIDLLASKKIKSGSLALNGEFYTKDNSKTIDRISIGFEGNYPVTSFMTFNAGYLLMNYNMTDYREIRNRFFSTLAVKWRLSDFVFSHRERIQLTRKPLPGANVKNDLYWRNRFRVEYKKPEWKVTPTATIESFYSFGNSGTKTVDELRYSLAVKYSLSQNQDICLYGLWSELVYKDFYVFGVEYEISI